MSERISRVPASPKVRKFARELGANVVEILGTQRAGRVSEEDVKNFIRSQVTISGGKIEKKITYPPAFILMTPQVWKDQLDVISTT